MVHAESEADEIDPSTIANRAATWRKRKSPATTAQLNFLSQLGAPLHPDQPLSRSEASDLISVILATRRHDGYVVPKASGEAIERGASGTRAAAMRLPHKATGIPSSTPADIIPSASRSTRRVTLAGVAPSAIRTPISWIRRATV